MAEKKESVSGERIFTIPLRKEWLKASRTNRTNKSVKTVKNFLGKHMKSDQVNLSEKVNQKIWVRGIHKPPGKIKVKAVMDKEGVVKVMLPDEKPKKVEEKKKEESEEPKTTEEKVEGKAPEKEKPKPSEKEAHSKEPPKDKPKVEKPKEKE
jgi:large subunit ribosomal protein L31e